MAITAAMVKELREISGAGMMDCKKALTATEGDMDKAMDCTEESKQNRSRRYCNAESCRRFPKSCRCRSKC